MKKFKLADIKKGTPCDRTVDTSTKPALLLSIPL